MKQIYLTLDFEEDYGTASRKKCFLSHNHSEKFIRFVKENDLRVTLFVTGEILDNQPELVEPYVQENGFFEFETHGYNHEDVYAHVDKRIENINRGVMAYKRFFAREPKVYRAPNGIISGQETEFLMANNIKFSSSIFPAFFPGRFNNLHVPQSPFKFKNTDFVEMPFSTTPVLRIPIALSYIELMGLGFMKIAMTKEIPNDIIFDFHLHDIFPQESYHKTSMPFIHKLFYLRSSAEGYAWATWEKTVRYFKNNKFTFSLLSSYRDQLSRLDLPELASQEVFK